jgi:hypothetical protein
MTIVEIIAYENNSHRNQCGNFKTIPEGWAVVPDNLDTPNFPFGNIVVEEIDGVMTVTRWTACPCPEPEETPKIVNSIDLSSYFAFCTNTSNISSSNCPAIECAFGKNNEDRIFNLGMQLAMYSWFCGDSKTEFPFTELCKCCTLTDIETNNAAFKELWENNTLRWLYMRGEDGDPFKELYPSNRVMRQKWRMAGNYSSTTWTVEITSEDIAAGYLWWTVDGNLKHNRTRTFSCNDVIFAEYTNDTGILLSIHSGVAINLSDCGITSPGSYIFAMGGTSDIYPRLAMFQKTTS